MKESKNKEINEDFMDWAQHASFILEFREVELDTHTQDVCDLAYSHQKSFFKQVYKNISCCENSEQINLVYQSTMTFLMFSLFKLIEEMNDQNRLDPKFKENTIEFVKNRLNEIITNKGNE